MRKTLKFLNILNVFRALPIPPAGFYLVLLGIYLILSREIRSEVDIYWEPNFYNTQVLNSQSEDVHGYRDRGTNSVQRLGISVEQESGFAGLNVDLDLAMRLPNEEFNFYLGRDAHVTFWLPIGDVWLGRRAFYRNDLRESITYNSPIIYEDFYGLDGGEGLGIDILHWEKAYIQVFIWDYYRGFPIWEYQQTPIYLDGEKAAWKQGERYRQGIRIAYQNEGWNLDGDFFYLNLGNWGEKARDDKNLLESEGGDGDHLYRFRAGVGYSWEHIGFTLHYHITRGLDKTFADPKRPERSMPIRGEAVQLDTLGKWDRFFLRFFQFLPNTPQTDESKDSVSMGYVGMGSPISGGAFHSREWNLYPAAWVTEYGLEWNRFDSDDFFGARGSASFSRLEFGMAWGNLNIIFRGEYTLPRKIFIQDKGRISLQKRDYEDWFLAETGVRFEYGERVESTASMLGVNVSTFWTQENIGIRGTMIQVYGRYVF
ncbi:MAG: hypothetical protein JJT78_00295 [Leptospira sp.]|nr:hypothetical protein [Leptospira sp.]